MHRMLLRMYVLLLAPQLLLVSRGWCMQTPRRYPQHLGVLLRGITYST